MPVSRIKRTAFGPLHLNALPRGELSEVSGKAVTQLMSKLDVSVENVLEFGDQPAMDGMARLNLT